MSSVYGCDIRNPLFVNECDKNSASLDNEILRLKSPRKISPITNDTIYVHLQKIISDEYDVNDDICDILIRIQHDANINFI